MTVGFVFKSQPMRISTFNDPHCKLDFIDFKV